MLDFSLPLAGMGDLAGYQHLSWMQARMDQHIPCCCWCGFVAQSCPTLLQPHGLWPARLLCPWDFPGKNTGVGCHSLLQGIFSTQGSNLCLLYWQADSLPLSHQGSQEHFISYSKENSHNSGAWSKYPFYGVNFQGLLKTSSYSYQQDGVLGSSALIYPKETLL